MGCKNILFLQPVQVFKILYFNTLKKNTAVYFQEASFSESLDTSDWQNDSIRLKSRAYQKPST